MFEIDRLRIVTKLDGGQISEEKYYAIFGNNALELDKELFIVDENEEVDEDLKNVYYQHLVEARAESMKEHLVGMQKSIDSFLENNFFNTRDIYNEKARKLLHGENMKKTMLELDRLAYFKAQKLLWEDKISKELAKIEEEKVYKEPDKSKVCS